MAPRVGCQTYTWQALHELGRWHGGFDEIVEAIAEAGFDGVETTPVMLGGLFDQPERLRKLLASHGLELAALALSTPLGWTEPAAAEDELALAERAIALLEAFGPGARLALGGGRSGSRDAYDDKFNQMIGMYHRVAERALRRGLVVNVHPTSGGGSLIRTKTEYERLVAALDPALVSLGPDTGHIVRGDEAPLELIRRNFGRISHMHLKDAMAGGDYAFMGTGDANIEGVVRFLVDAGYAGWLIAEEESEVGIADPPAAVRACREYLRELGQ